jgi:hypothetical protein
VQNHQIFHGRGGLKNTISRLPCLEALLKFDKNYADTANGKIIDAMIKTQPWGGVSELDRQ